MSDLEKKKFPIGPFEAPENICDTTLDTYIKVIKDFPGRLKNLIEHFTDDQLDTPYREGGWTIRQLVNHLSDSHMNSFIRFKLALTEDNPTIKPYDEAKWAELQDSYHMPVKPAMRMLKGTHQRWVVLLKSLTNKQFERTFHHPEHNRDYNLRDSLALYVWHCNHHFAHIENLKIEKRLVRKRVNNPIYYKEIIDRISMLSENSPGKWGKMDVCQMLKHCDLVLQVALKKVELPRINFVYKTIGIFTKTEMYVFNNGIPRNMPTFQKLIVNFECDFDVSKTNLLKTLEEFREACEKSNLPDHHRLFGNMTEKDWTFLEYKHLDHHLKQFNV